MNAHEILTRLAAGLLAALAGFFQSYISPAFSRPAVEGITYGDLAGVGCMLAMVLALHAGAGRIMRRRAEVARQDQKETKQNVFHASTKPVYLLLWIVGVYFVLAPLLSKLPADILVTRTIIDKLLDLGLCVTVIWFILRLTRLLEARLAVWAANSKTRLDDLLVPLIGKISRIIIPVLGFILVLPVLELPPEYAEAVTKASSILIIIAVAMILFQSVAVGEKVLLAEGDLTQADNLNARKIHTQVKLLSKTVNVAIGFCAVASILMLFQQVRHLGTSLLASAGIAGIIAGIAAQQTLANLFAGFQIAFAQPIRQDDVVIVEGEWGRIEEITLTYVVVHIWDDRRMVLPLSYFIQKPFQNWTRVSAQLLGSVFIWVDYSFPVEAGRAALKSIIENSPLWDKRFWNLQVSDATDRTMQLRILATSADSSKSWDLRCKIREEFIAYIQKHHPEGLPKVRAELGNVSVEMDQPKTAPGEAVKNLAA